MSRFAGQLRRWGRWWLCDTPLTVTSPILIRIRAVAAAITHSSMLNAVGPVLVIAVCAALQLGRSDGSTQSPPLIVALFSALLALPLLWRRTHPLTAFVVVAGVALLQWMLDVRTVADIALLIALYSVAVRHPARVGWLAAAVVEVGSVLAVIGWVAPDGRVESLVLLTGPVAAAVFAGVAVRNRRAALSAAAERLERLERERHQEIIIELAAERARIAREMHDVVAHGLSLMITMAQAAVLKQSSDPPAATAAMQQVAASGREALGDMRALLGVLRPDGEHTGRRPQPALADLGMLIDKVRRTGFNIDMHTTGTQPEMGLMTQVTIYRIVQEALTNVIKHADRPSHVQVTLVYQPEQVVIHVDDDGQLPHTCSPESLSRQGFGLTGMRERAGILGGWVSADHDSLRGWRVMAVIPTKTQP